MHWTEHITPAMRGYGIFFAATVLTPFYYVIILSTSLQIGLDGIKMLDPSTSRMLRIYPLENIARCEVSLFHYFYFVLFYFTSIVGNSELNMYPSNAGD